MAAFVGIDLGTTNSVLATFDGEAVAVVPNGLGETLTPSVVRLDASGAATVGRRALRFLETDPGNARAGFKRLMGTGEGLDFEAPGRVLLPEELSAAVLRSLLADARDALGFAPRAAVISTPALFELPQSHATVRAGKLAGLEEVVLIQEPIASAIAAGWRAEQQGLWLVFDLGGGTLDVSLLETKDGRLRVVDHAGDNFLGGKDIDDALCDWAAGEIHRRFGIAGIDRAAPASERNRRALGKLRVACEQAKIELSRAERTAIVVPELGVDMGGAPIDLDLTISRGALAALAAPLVARSLAVVRALLEKNHCAAAEVGRVALVGGPTLMPELRARVGALFGGRIIDGIDPMTAVARGAALYAGTAGLEARPSAPAPSPRAGLAVRVEHPAVTADLGPFVVGRFLPAAGEALPERIRVARADGGFETADTEVSAEGSFVVEVELARDRRNLFSLRAFDAAGAAVRLATGGFAIVHGISIADPPLARSVGVACADDLTQIYFAKGTPLPARRTFVHHTVKPVSARSGDDALAIPVVQGESNRAHRNRLIGLLSIAGVEQDLPAGARVEVTLELDRSGQLRARADVPALGRTFEDVAHVLVPTASVDTAERELGATARRADELQRRTFASGTPAAVESLGAIAGMLAEMEGSLAVARAGDADAGLKLHRLLLDVNAILDEAETILEWPELEREARSCMLFYTPLVSQWGTAAEQALYDEALGAAASAQKRRDLAQLEAHLDAVRSIGKASYCRNPESLSTELDWVAAHVTEAVDVPRAHLLIGRARAAESAGSVPAARALLTAIWDLFPSSPEVQRKSFGSGVR
jgi:molecular chaperone DnaK